MFYLNLLISIDGYVIKVIFISNIIFNFKSGVIQYHSQRLSGSEVLQIVGSLFNSIKLLIVIEFCITPTSRGILTLPSKKLCIYSIFDQESFATASVLQTKIQRSNNFVECVDKPK